MTISMRAQDVRSQRLPGHIGDRVTSSYLDRIDTILNKSPQAKQVGTVVIDTATDDEEYSILVNGVEVSFTSGTGTTETLIAAGLADAVNQEPLIRGQVEAESDAGTLTLTGLRSGVAFTLTEGENAAKMTTTEASTSAAEAEAIPFGRLCCSTEYSEATKLGFLAKSSLFTAQVDSYVLVYDADVEIVAEIVVEGETYRAGIVMAAASDVDTEAALLVSAINDAMPANTVLAAYVAADDTLTLTAEVAGKPFVSSISFHAPAGATVDTGSATKSSNASAETDVTLAAAGISLRRSDEEITSIAGTSAEYPANAGAAVIGHGRVWVESTETVSPGDPVYVELGSSNSGRLYATSSSTRVRLPAGKARWERSTSDGIAAVSVNF